MRSRQLAGAAQQQRCEHRDEDRDGNVGPTVAASRSVKRVGMNVIDAVQSTVDSSGRSSLFYLYDFDGPTGAGASGGPTLGNAVAVTKPSPATSIIRSLRIG